MMTDNDDNSLVDLEDASLTEDQIKSSCYRLFELLGEDPEAVANEALLIMMPEEPPILQWQLHKDDILKEHLIQMALDDVKEG